MKRKMDILSLVRPNIQKLKPYSSARDEYSGSDKVFLDANENPYGNVHNRYPDPTQSALKQGLSQLKNISPQNIFLGNGSDEGIDILIRTFCEPGKDNIVIAEPTYGMYEVSADINNVRVLKCDLTEDFQLNAERILATADSNSKILFLCSPNNPTGNLMDEKETLKLVESFQGIVVIDEAYIDYAGTKSWTERLDEYPNLVVLQTMSKAWGLAAIRLGLGFASKQVIDIMNKVKPPYNISRETQDIALKALRDTSEYRTHVEKTLQERGRLVNQLKKLAFVKKIFKTDANFVLISVEDSKGLYQHLIKEGIVVRDRSRITHCDSCLRITIGTEIENQQLMKALNNY